MRRIVPLPGLFHVTKFNSVIEKFVAVSRFFCIDLLDGPIAYVHFTPGDETIRSMEGLQWDAHELRIQNFRALLRLRHRCAASCLSMVLFSDGSPRNLLVDAAEPCLFASPAFFAARRYLPHLSILLLQWLYQLLTTSDVRCLYFLSRLNFPRAVSCQTVPLFRLFRWIQWKCMVAEELRMCHEVIKGFKYFNSRYRKCW